MEQEDSLSLYFQEIRRFPLLTAEEEVQLAKLVEAGGGEGKKARNKMVESNQRLIVSVAKKFQGCGVPLEDLISSGNEGLIVAVDKFDYRRGNRFSTLATWWVRQAIVRELGNEGRTIRLPIHVHEWIGDVKRVSQELEQELRRKASPEEIATELNISTRKVKMLIEVSRGILSLDESRGYDEDSASLGDLIPDESSPAPGDEVDLTHLGEELDEVLKSLPPRTEAIMRMRYGLDGTGEGKSLKAVGDEFNITRERVRQISLIALRRLAHPIRARRLEIYLKGD